MPTQWYGNTFYDFPGQDALRHAMGTHLGNDFQVAAKMQYIGWVYFAPVSILSVDFQKPLVSK